MPVDHLSLRGFRSYRELEVDFPAGPQVVVGDNAAGKTNLLEAMVVLSQGGSHRTTSDQELITWGEPLARLDAAVTAGRIEVVLLAAGTMPGARKRVKVNGVPRRTTALSDALRAVVFAPEDMQLVVGSPSLRRGSLDTLVAQHTGPRGGTPWRPTHVPSPSATTCSGASGKRPPGATSCPTGTGSCWRRAAASSMARRDHGRARRTPGRRPRRDRAGGRAAHACAPSPTRRPGRVNPSRTHSADAWRRRPTRRSGTGPRSSDPIATTSPSTSTDGSCRGSRPAASSARPSSPTSWPSSTCSRSADGRAPLLLLDDVFSELDPQRRAHLVRRIGGLPQAFVTTTALADLDPALVAAATAWQVVPGRLERVG